MIQNTARFICPKDRGGLSWPDGRCITCGTVYLLNELPRLDGRNGTFRAYDFRPSLQYVTGDRQNLGAHWKIISGLLEFERERLAHLGYRDIREGVRRDQQRVAQTSARLAYTRRTLRNVVSALRALGGDLKTMKADGDDSRHGSFEGYSRAYELVSYFAEPHWVGHYRGKIAHTSSLLHHLTNMERLTAILHDWKAREVLEFGCGSGVNLLLLRHVAGLSDGVHLSGFDYPVTRFLTARSTIEAFDLSVDDLFIADGMHMPLADNSLDVVFSHYVIEQLAGFEDKALAEMLRVARMGVVLFETAVFQPTINERLYMSHSGYSRDLPAAVRRLKDVDVVRIENISSDRFFGCPNVMFVVRKK